MNDDAMSRASAEAMGVNLELEEQLNDMIGMVQSVSYPYGDETYNLLLLKRDERTLLDVPGWK